MILIMTNKPIRLEIEPKDRPSRYSIHREGKSFTLTNREVLEATEALLHRMSNDAVHYFAEVYEEELSKECLKLFEDNIVRGVLNELPREILERANKTIGGEKAPPVEYLFSKD